MSQSSFVHVCVCVCTPAPSSGVVWAMQIEPSPLVETLMIRYFTCSITQVWKGDTAKEKISWNVYHPHLTGPLCLSWQMGPPICPSLDGAARLGDLHLHPVWRTSSKEAPSILRATSAYQPFRFQASSLWHPCGACAGRKRDILCTCKERVIYRQQKVTQSPASFACIYSLDLVLSYRRRNVQLILSLGLYWGM